MLTISLLERHGEAVIPISSINTLQNLIGFYKSVCSGTSGQALSFKKCELAG